MLPQNSELRIDCFISKTLDANCYLVSDCKQSIVIDPCVNYQEVYRKYGLPIVAVFLTHGHIDHFSELNSYLKENVKVYLHRQALAKLADPLKNYSFYLNKAIHFNLLASQYEIVYDKKQIMIFGSPILVLEVPGHSDCSIILLINNIMFSGDTLFQDGIGRTDLYSGNMAKMLFSLNKIKNLKFNYEIFPGHGQKTTLDQEKKQNIYLIRSSNG